MGYDKCCECGKKLKNHRRKKCDACDYIVLDVTAKTRRRLKHENL